MEVGDVEIKGTGGTGGEVGGCGWSLNLPQPITPQGSQVAPPSSPPSTCRDSNICPRSRPTLFPFTGVHLRSQRDFIAPFCLHAASSADPLPPNRLHTPSRPTQHRPPPPRPTPASNGLLNLRFTFLAYYPDHVHGRSLPLASKEFAGRAQ